MADTPKVYVLCDANCKWEGMTKEQILTAITQAVENGEITDVDTGFVSTVKTINGTGLKFFVGEQWEYDALTAEQKDGLFAIITNDTTKEGMEEFIAEVERELDRLDGIALKVNSWAVGETAVPKAQQAQTVAPEETKAVTVSIPESGDAYVTLEKNTLYQVVVGTISNGVLAAMTLYVGDCPQGAEHIYHRSSIGGSTGHDTFMVMYKQSNDTSKNIVELMRVGLSAGTIVSANIVGYATFIPLAALPPVASHLVG